MWRVDWLHGTDPVIRSQWNTTSGGGSLNSRFQQSKGRSTKIMHRWHRCIDVWNKNQIKINVSMKNIKNIRTLVQNLSSTRNLGHLIGRKRSIGRTEKTTWIPLDLEEDGVYVVCEGVECRQRSPNACWPNGDIFSNRITHKKKKTSLLWA